MHLASAENFSKPHLLPARMSAAADRCRKRLFTRFRVVRLPLRGLGFPVLPMAHRGHDGEENVRTAGGRTKSRFGTPIAAVEISPTPCPGMPHPRNCVVAATEQVGQKATMARDRGSGSDRDQAALPAADTADFTARAEGALPTPVSSQPSSAEVTRAKAVSVLVSGTSFRPDSMDASVARESPARRPSSEAESSDSFRSKVTRAAIVSTATSIAVTTNVVKCLPVAAIRVDGQDPRVRTLAERIRWIQDHSGPTKLSLAAVAEKGGLTRQGLSRIVRQSAKAPNQSVGKGGTLERLASGNNVDHTWLVTGKGVPRRGKLSALDTVLTERDWPEQARAAARAEKRDLSAEQWRSLLTRVAAAFDSIDAPPKKNRSSSIPAK